MDFLRTIIANGHGYPLDESNFVRYYSLFGEYRPEYYQTYLVELNNENNRNSEINPLLLPELSRLRDAVGYPLAMFAQEQSVLDAFQWQYENGQWDEFRLGSFTLQNEDDAKEMLKALMTQLATIVLQ